MGKSCKRQGHESGWSEGVLLPVRTRKLHCNDCERKHLQVLLQLEKIVFRYVFDVFNFFYNKK